MPPSGSECRIAAGPAFEPGAAYPPFEEESTAGFRSRIRSAGARAGARALFRAAETKGEGLAAGGLPAYRRLHLPMQSDSGAGAAAERRPSVTLRATTHVLGRFGQFELTQVRR